MNQDMSQTQVPGTEINAAFLAGNRAEGVVPPEGEKHPIVAPNPSSETADDTEQRKANPQPTAPILGMQVTRHDDGAKAAPVREYVVGYLFSPDGQAVALIEKNHPAWQYGKFNGIGGKIEPGESKHEAMCREFEEEAGVYIEPDAWLHFRTEQFDATSSNKSDQDSGTRVHHFTTIATEAAWAEVQSMEKEVVTKMKFPFNEVTIPRLIYNLPYLVPMAAILLNQPAENRPLP